MHIVLLFACCISFSFTHFIIYECWCNERSLVKGPLMSNFYLISGHEQWLISLMNVSHNTWAIIWTWVPLMRRALFWKKSFMTTFSVVVSMSTFDYEYECYRSWGPTMSFYFFPVAEARLSSLYRYYGAYFC